MPETSDRQQQDMQERYRNVFSSEEGRRVMGDILALGHVFDTLDPLDPVANSERNFAVVIGRSAGVFDPLYIHLGMNDKEK